MAEVFANPLVDLAEYTDMKQDLDKGKGPVQISGVTDSQKVHVMHELSKDNPWRLVVTYDDTRAKEIFDDFSYFEPNTWLYPARDLLFYSSDIHGNLLTRQRMQVFKHLLEDEGGVVVTTVDGLMDHLLPLSRIKESCLNIMVGQTLDMEEIKHLLTGMGYERMGQVDGMGQFSVRGGILDVFPLTEEVPVRIELWGDEVDSIRSFDAESQRSIQQMDEVTIYPAVEHTGEPDMVSFLDYFPKEKSVIFLDEPNRLTEKGQAVEEEYRQSRMHREEKGSQNLPENWLCSFEQLQKELNKRNCISVCALEPTAGRIIFTR